MVAEEGMLTVGLDGGTVKGQEGPSTRSGALPRGYTADTPIHQLWPPFLTMSLASPTPGAHPLPPGTSTLTLNPPHPGAFSPSTSSKALQSQGGVRDATNSKTIQKKGGTYQAQ